MKKGKPVHIFSGLSPAEADEWFRAREATFKVAADGDGLECKKCSSTIMAVTAYISVHVKEFPGHAGGGEVRQVPYPYCPKCEGEPTSVSGCIHI